MRLLPLLTIIALFLAAACSGGGDDEPAPTATQPPTNATPTQAPETTATSATTPTQPATPSGTHTGIPQVDALLDIVTAGDRLAFESLLKFTEAPCTDAQGLGGPPKCLDFPGPPAEGESVEAFYHSTCEGEWRTDMFPVVDAFFLSQPELFGVFELNMDRPLWGEPFLPQPTYGVVFEMGPDQHSGFVHSRSSLLLGVETDGSITIVDFPCGNRTPDFFLSTAAEPAYGEKGKLIYAGPALTNRTGSSTGNVSLDSIIAAIANGDRAALKDFFEFTQAPCTNSEGLGGPPKCQDAPGSPPEGTIVEAFPTGFCEGVWTYDVDGVIDSLAAGSAELYAVLWDRSSQPSEELPRTEFNLVFAYEDPRYQATPLAVVVGVNEGKVRSVHRLCLSHPSMRLKHLNPGEFVILYGPAFP